jgi:hypothetical protein
MKICFPHSKLTLLVVILIISVWGANAQNTGIGTFTPTHTLHVKPDSTHPYLDPLRIENMQPYHSASDSLILVMSPDSGIIRYRPISTLPGGSAVSGDNDPANELQDASEVLMVAPVDFDQDGTPELTVEQALQALFSTIPKGIYKSIGDARAAGLQDGDSFIAHPEGILGCSGCIITLNPNMN